jgi:secreted PhoX family phosphatase
VAGKPLAFYMGDDSRGEYVYKFVTEGAWERGRCERAASPRAPSTSTKARSMRRSSTPTAPAPGSGWTSRTRRCAGYAAYAFADLADVLVNARIAADAAGATKMDRPEWTAVNPQTARSTSR